MSNRERIAQIIHDAECGCAGGLEPQTLRVADAIVADGWVRRDDANLEAAAHKLHMNRGNGGIVTCGGCRLDAMEMLAAAFGKDKADV